MCKAIIIVIFKYRILNKIYMTEEKLEKIKELMKTPVKIRNIGVCAHILY